MQRILSRITVFVMTAVISVLTVSAQEPTSVDPKLLEFENARIPKEYTIASVAITGIRYLDTAIVLSISGLQVGDKFTHPGTDIFSRAISNLWRQKLFSNVQVFITKIEGDQVSVEVSVQERPKLGNFKFVGIKKNRSGRIAGKDGAC